MVKVGNTYKKEKIMTHKYNGQLEIDSNRGVIYFHSVHGVTLLRICSLPKPIPKPIVSLGGGRTAPMDFKDFKLLDITFGYGVSWAPCTCTEDSDSEQNINCPIHKVKGV
jgi:hypothetical protein